MFFTAVNPVIKNSGNGTESKFETIQLIPEKLRPKTLFIPPNTSINEIENLIQDGNLEFPLIAKPDIGFRGLLVKKINSLNELETYLSKYPIDFILQEFIDFTNECGIFYHRNPNEKSGRITSITLKKFLTVQGNGTDTLKELILNNARARVYFQMLKDIHKNEMETIIEKDKTVALNSIGNHAKGTQFIDGNHLISKELTAVFDKINLAIPGWFYGRLDIRFESLENLKNGQFKILEINGIISEPTHIYDASKNSYFTALKSIQEHWKIIYEIATTNKKNHQKEYGPIIPFLKDLKALKSYSKEVQRLSKTN